MRPPRLKGKLAAALALGTAAAVPTVVSLSEEPRYSQPWAASSSNDAPLTPALADTAWWGLSRVVEGFLAKIGQPGVEKEELEDDWYSEEDAEEEALQAEAVASAATQAAEQQASLEREQAGAAGPPVQQVEGQHLQGTGRQRRRVRRVQDVSATVLAARHAGEMRHMRQLASAELARINATSASLPSRHHKQQQQQQQEQQQQPRAKRRWHGGTPAAGAEPHHSPALLPPAAQATDSASSTTGFGAAAASTAGAADSAEHAAAEHTETQSARKQPSALANSLDAEEASQLPPLPPRFTDAELMRFAVMHGLLRAANSAERRQALRAGAAAAARTAAWLRTHRFASEEELQGFGHMVQWRGCDSTGHPILHISIGQAVVECPGPAALVFANAVITLMEQGVSELLWDGTAAAMTSSGQLQPAANSIGGGSGSAGNSTGSGDSEPASEKTASGITARHPSGSPSPPADAHAADSMSSGAAANSSDARLKGMQGPEQIVVVMDCTGASTLSAARLTRLVQAVAATLNQHYPGRLHELVIVNMPVVLGWMVAGIKKLVHPDTRHKFKVVPHGQQWPAPNEPHNHSNSHDHSHSHNQPSRPGDEANHGDSGNDGVTQQPKEEQHQPGLEQATVAAATEGNEGGTPGATEGLLGGGFSADEQP